MSEFKLEPLGEDFGVFVSKEHSFGTDAFLLSAFANPKKSDTACDLGTGCGIIPLLWYRPNTTPPKSVLAVDIQKQAIEQLKETCEKYSLEKITAVQCDMKTLPKEYNGRFSLVTCNPPYFKDGILSESDADKTARHETACGIDDVVKTASRLLCFGGRLVLCQRPERLSDVIDSMRKHSVEPKRLQLVQKDENGTPWLVLIEGKKGAKPFLNVLPTLLVYKDGEYTDYMKKIYWGE